MDCSSGPLYPKLALRRQTDGQLPRFFHSISSMVFRLGGPGLLLVGIIDSSFLTAPLANDLLIIAQIATHPPGMFYYALTAAIGSIISCLSVDVINRKAEQEFKRNFPSGRWKFVESHFQKNAAWTVIVAPLMPPPFPFTPVVAAAAATGDPRKKLLGFVGIARLARFTAEGALAITYGKHILSIAKSPTVQHIIIALIIIAFVGSAISIFTWIRQSKASKRAKRQSRSNRHNAEQIGTPYKFAFLHGSTEAQKEKPRLAGGGTSRGGGYFLRGAAGNLILVHDLHDAGRQNANLLQFLVGEEQLFLVSSPLDVPKSGFVRDPGKLRLGHSQQVRRTCLSHIFRYLVIHVSPSSRN